MSLNDAKSRKTGENSGSAEISWNNFIFDQGLFQFLDFRRYYLFGHLFRYY